MSLSESNTTTIVFAKQVPDLFQVGVDLLFFNNTSSDSNFKGIKLVPEGLHFAHITNVLSNTRSGVFFHCHQGEVIIVDFDPEGDLIVQTIVQNQKGVLYGSLSDPALEQRVRDSYPFMLNFSNFQKQNDKWGSLVRQLRHPEAFLKTGSELFSCPIRTTDSSTKEVETLKKALLDSAKLRESRLGGDIDKFIKTVDLDGDQAELRLTVLDEKRTFRKGSSIEEMTKHSLDKSQYIKDNYGETPESSFLAEYEFCFVGALILNNYCCLQQWYTMTRLLLQSVDLINEQSELALRFIDLFRIQLNIVLENRHDDEELTDGPFIDIHELAGSLRNMMKNLDMIENLKIIFAISSLAEFLNEQFQMKLAFYCGDSDSSSDD